LIVLGRIFTGFWVDKFCALVYNIGQLHTRKAKNGKSKLHEANRELPGGARQLRQAIELAQELLT